MKLGQPATMELGQFEFWLSLCMVKMVDFAFNRKVARPYSEYAYTIDFLINFTLSIEQECLSLWSYEDIQTKGEAGDQSGRF